MRLWKWIFILFAILSCSSNVTDTQINKLTLNFDFSEAVAIGKYPETIEINISQMNNVENYYFTNIVNSIIINDLLNGDYNIQISISFSNEEMYSGESNGYFSDDTENIVNVYIRDAYVKLIVLVDTNSSDLDDINQFYNYSINGKYYKQYNLENAEELADNYIETPMIYFYTHYIYSHLDENMVPVVQYDFGEYYNPVTTCQTAIAFYTDYIENNNSESLTGFLNNTNWLIDNMDEHSYLHYDFEWTHCGQQMCDNWISGMAQGQALAVMCMAYHHTTEQIYLETANKLFSSLRNNKDEFWCVGIDSADYIWFEEYPNEDYCHVLNGSLFTMWGLWDYYCITRNQEALDMFEGGLISILDHYPNWNFEDADGSLYCLHMTTITHYHSIHLNQLISYRDFFAIDGFNDMLTSFIEY